MLFVQPIYISFLILVTGTTNQDESVDTLENQKEESIEILDTNETKFKVETKFVIEEDTTTFKMEVSIVNIFLIYIL